MPPRSFHIYCDGGFGNRFNALVAGLAIARAAGLRPVIGWPCNNWCAASCGSLIEPPAPVLDRELAVYAQAFDQFHHCMTEDHLRTGVANRSPLELASLDEALAWIAASPRDVFFHTALIPSWLDHAQVIAQVRSIKFRPELLARAAHLAAELGIDGRCIGLQIRKTDFGAMGADDQRLMALVSGSPDQRFFVCSDDAEVERRFAACPHVVVHAKQAYVGKQVDGSWATPIVDHSGRVYPFNVYRSAASVADAVVDLLLLSRTRILRTSGSTFLHTAVWLAAASRDRAESAMQASVVPQAG